MYATVGMCCTCQYAWMEGNILYRPANIRHIQHVPVVSACLDGIERSGQARRQPARHTARTNCHIQCTLFTNNSVQEQIFRAKTSRMTNGFLDYEHTSWQQRQAESISAGVSCCLTLAQYTSLLDFGLRKFRFTNGLQERIKFVNRGSTVYLFYLLMMGY
jgi:hypothetical protein